MLHKTGLTKMIVIRLIHLMPMYCALCRSDHNEERTAVLIITCVRYGNDDELAKAAAETQGLHQKTIKSNDKKNESLEKKKQKGDENKKTMCLPPPHHRNMPIWNIRKKRG